MPTLYLGAKREIATFAGEMRQVLSNLPVNAIDAIEKMARLRFMLMLHVLLQRLTCRAEVHLRMGFALALGASMTGCAVGPKYLCNS
jgi:hypothetical protein